MRMEIQTIEKGLTQVGKAGPSVTAVLQRVMAQVDGFEVSVTDDEEYTQVLEARKTVKVWEKEVEKAKRSILDPINAAHNAASELFKPVTDGLKKATANIDNALIGYKKILEAKAAEQRRLAEAEKQRLLDEARKQREERAKAALLEGKTELAEAILKDKPRVVVPITPIVAVPKVQGACTVDVWSAEIVDFSKVTDEYKLPDMVKLNSLARSLKDENAAPPGVRFVKRDSVRSRT
jgi:hypothetical protein